MQYFPRRQQRTIVHATILSHSTFGNLCWASSPRRRHKRTIPLLLASPGREDEAADKGGRAAYKDITRKKRAFSHMMIHAPISLGELIDKISILQIKMERIKDPGKRANVAH